MVFDWPFSNTPVSHLAAFYSVAVWGISPTLVKVTLVPALTRVRPGQYRYSSLLSPIFIMSAPCAIGPAGPATFEGGGGGHNGPNCPFSEKDQTASP